MNLTTNQLKEALTNTIKDMRGRPETLVVRTALRLLLDEIITIEQNMSNIEGSVPPPSSNKAMGTRP